MVGKPNLPDTGDDRPDLKGSAAPTPGLAALDQEREASMADEGGASAAFIEAEDPALAGEILGARTCASTHSSRRLPLLFGLAAGLAIGFWTYKRGRAA